MAILTWISRTISVKPSISNTILISRSKIHEEFMLVSTQSPCTIESGNACLTKFTGRALHQRYSRIHHVQGRYDSNSPCTTRESGSTGSSARISYAACMPQLWWLIESGEERTDCEPTRQTVSRDCEENPTENWDKVLKDVPLPL